MPTFICPFFPCLAVFLPHSSPILAKDQKSHWGIIRTIHFTSKNDFLRARHLRSHFLSVTINRSTVKVKLFPDYSGDWQTSPRDNFCSSCCTRKMHLWVVLETTLNQSSFIHYKHFISLTLNKQKMLGCVFSLGFEMLRILWSSAAVPWYPCRLWISSWNIASRESFPLFS